MPVIPGLRIIGLDRNPCPDRPPRRPDWLHGFTRPAWRAHPAGVGFPFVQNAFDPLAFFDVEGWRRWSGSRDHSLPSHAPRSAAPDDFSFAGLPSAEMRIKSSPIPAMNPSSTLPSIHGHEVIQMIVDADRAFSRCELIAEIESEFGPGARFHTCSAEDLSAEGLVDFLVSRGKFHGDDQAMALDPSKVCQH